VIKLGKLENVRGIFEPLKSGNQENESLIDNNNNILRKIFHSVLGGHEN
jgi:hypothetical protein